MFFCYAIRGYTDCIKYLSKGKKLRDAEEKGWDSLNIKILLAAVSCRGHTLSFEYLVRMHSCTSLYVLMLVTVWTNFCMKGNFFTIICLKQT